MNLYRAAQDDYIQQTSCFAARKSDAKAYLDNPGFGGPILYKTTVLVEESRVLRLEGSSRECKRSLLRHLGVDAFMTVGDCVGSFLGSCSSGRYVDQLAESYDWVVFTDSYPEDCETWMWLGGEEPELTEV